MPYKDPQIAKEKARERKKRWTEKNKPLNWADGRGKHKNHIKSEKHYRWNNKLFSKDGYALVRVGKLHPLADPNGYVMEHLIVWVSARFPIPTEDQVLHHKNGNKTDNRLDNLWLLKKAEHNFIHNLEKGKNEQGQFIGHKAAGRLLDGRTHDDLVWKKI